MIVASITFSSIVLLFARIDSATRVGFDVFRCVEVFLEGDSEIFLSLRS